MKKLSLLLVGAVSVAGLAGTPQAAHSLTQGTSYRFASAPDFLNADNADVSDSPYWQPGDPNSINASYATGLRTVLDDLKTNLGTGTDVLIPGDLVEGRWGRDDLKTGIFGPTDTVENRLRAIRLAARQYYGAQKSRFSSRGLVLHPILGDHELGDNPWNRYSTRYYFRFKYQHVADFKAVWAKHFTASGTRYADHPRGTAYDGTAYAFRPDPEVQIISLDVWRRTSSTVRPQVAPEELSWVQDVIAKANADGVDWIIVQGHVPVVGPVRARHSSRIMYRGGADSPLWQVMRDGGVDLYLCGEVHDTTAITPADLGQTSGPVQITHGGLFYQGEFSYLIASILDGTMTIETREFDTSHSDTYGSMWQTQRYRIQPDSVTYSTTSHVSGTMTLDKDGMVSERSGMLATYTP